MWNLKSDTNELIYKTETDSQTENKLMVTQGESGGISRHTLLYIKDINSKDLLEQA